VVDRDVTTRRVARALRAPVRAVGKVLPHGESDGGSGSSGRPGPDSAAGALSPVVPSAVVDCGLYVDGRREPGTPHYAEALRRARSERNAFVWLGVHEPTAEEFADIATTFDLHPLAVEDAVKAFQRPKLDLYGESAFVVVKTARYVEHEELTATSQVVETGDVMVFLGPQFVITVRHGDACRLTGVRAELERHPDRLRQGPWSVFHAVADNVVDLYVAVGEALEDDIDAVEAAVFSRETTDVQRIYQLKREIVEFKRAVVPLHRPLDQLQSGHPESVPTEVRAYIRDVADHLVRVTEQVTSFDDLLTSILQAQLAQVGIQQSNDMRKISAWVAIAAVWTAIAGIYGMNFEYMPELTWRFGYPMVLCVMVGVSVTLYRAFRRSGWL